MAEPDKKRETHHGRDTDLKRKALNKFRKANGLKPNVLMERECLRCERVFTSQSHVNRLCVLCIDIAKNRGQD